MKVIAENRPNSLHWSMLLMGVLGFWLSSSLLLDFVILPGLASTGMTLQAGFASAGYVIFETFNHIELLCAAVVLTGFLSIAPVEQKQRLTVLALILLAIAFLYTYLLTPQMSGLGLSLNLFEPATAMPTSMIQMQWSYWSLEVIKIVIGATLLRWCYSQVVEQELG